MSLYDVAKNLNDFMDAVDRGEIPEEAVYDTPSKALICSSMTKLTTWPA